MIKKFGISSLKMTSLAVGACLFLSACSSSFATRGNKVDEDRLAEIIPEEVHARDVADILGTPSTYSTFATQDGEIWYYISEQVEYYAFLEPEIINREVVQIKFGRDGFVQWVEKDANSQGRDIQFVDRVTHTAGNELSFFEQIFGNLGRFNNE